MKRVIEVPWKASQALLVFLASWIGVPLLAFIVLGSLGAYYRPAHELYNALADGQMAASFGLVMLEVLVGFWLIQVILKRYGVGWSSLGLRRFRLGQATIYVVVTLIGFLILVALSFALISWLVPSFQANQAQTNEFTSPTTSGAVRLSFLALVVIPPFFEEVIFRGFIFPALTKRWGIIFGAIATSLLFAVAHWQLNVSLYTLILSLLLCFMYYKLHSLWPGIFLHMINNYIAFTALIHK